MRLPGIPLQLVSMGILPWPRTYTRSLRGVLPHEFEGILPARKTKILSGSLPGDTCSPHQARLRQGVVWGSAAGSKQFCLPRNKKPPAVHLKDLCGLRLPLKPLVASGCTQRCHYSTVSSNSRPTSHSGQVWRVTVVGRANVGKSSLYNRFVTANSSSSFQKTRHQLAIVQPDPGTTRDRKEALCSCGSLSLLMTDTAGVQEECEAGNSAMWQQINEQVTRTLEASDVILFVIDGKEGVTPGDEVLAKRLLSLTDKKKKSLDDRGHLGVQRQQEKESNSSCPPSVILVLNKSEGPGVANCLADAYDLQLGHPVLVSARTNHGLETLFDRVRSAIRERQESLPIPSSEENQRSSSCRDFQVVEESVQAVAPVQHAAAEAWLEGLARRYGRGVRPVLAHMKATDDITLPWSLEKAPLESAGSDALDNTKEELQLDHRDLVDSSVEDSSVKDDTRPPETEDEDAEALDIRKSRRNPRNIETEQPIRLTFIGRPNAGKSSLINSLLNENRLTVSSTPGTTTDSVRIEFMFKKKQMTLIDTAGVCRGWKMRGDDLLQHASMQTMRNIRNSDVCILCLDATHVQETGHISSNDLSLANLATEKEGRCLVVCVTKWDLVDTNKQDHVRTMILERIRTGLGHLKSCPVVFTSATQAHNLNSLLNKALLMYSQWCSRVPTPNLNSWLQEYTARWPPPWRLGSQCQVKYITQAQTRPPTFVAWSNVYAHFPTNYKRQLINAIREEFSMKGVPVRLVLRTTAMPKPGAKLTKEEVLKWKRLGPHQHKAATKLARKYTVKK